MKEIWSGHKKLTDRPCGDIIRPFLQCTYKNFCCCFLCFLGFCFFSKRLISIPFHFHWTQKWDQKTFYCCLFVFYCCFKMSYLYHSFPMNPETRLIKLYYLIEFYCFFCFFFKCLISILFYFHWTQKADHKLYVVSFLLLFFKMLVSSRAYFTSIKPRNQTRKNNNKKTKKKTSVIVCSFSFVVFQNSLPLSCFTSIKHTKTDQKQLKFL